MLRGVGQHSSQAAMRGLLEKKLASCIDSKAKQNLYFAGKDFVFSVLYNNTAKSVIKRG